MDEDDTTDYRFGIRLLIRHPTIDPSLISKKLNLTPQHFWRAGADRKTPQGDPLPGKYTDTMWGYSYEIEGARYFFKEVAAFAEKLKPHKVLLDSIIDTGGFVDLIVNLPGDINIGDNLDWRELQKLAELRVVLGIEVFPEMN